MHSRVGRDQDLFCPNEIRGGIMAKVKTTARFQILELIDKFVDGATANAIGEAVVTEAKRMVSEGQSPVRGHGRFERYKNRQKYPGDLKPHRPVNLKLTGEMLAGLTFRQKSATSIEVGFIKASADRKKVAEFHTSGTEHMAMRRVIPQKDEEWAVSIMRRLRDLYGKRLETLIKRANRKSK